jgi:hypothetical protein
MGSSIHQQKSCEDDKETLSETAGTPKKIASIKIAHFTAPAGESRVDERRVDVAEKGF